MAEPSLASAGRRFELQRTLGVGSFGTVYLADMESSGGFRRRVALKLLNPTWDQQSDASTRLRDEARLLGRLQHRHIVRVDDLLQLEGRWALLMEYVEGADLECVVAPPDGVVLPAFTPRAALEVVAAASAALWAAAETPGAGGRPLAVVHRDIKPSNIRVTPQGEVKVLDFGVARADFQGREARTERVRYGSIGYMSPERLFGGDETSAGDVYALGVVLYELILGKSYGRCELAPEAQAAQVAAARAEIVKAAGEGVGDLLRDTLAYETEDRPSARTVEDRARALLSGRSDADLAQWSRVAIPMLARPAGDDPEVLGRVLAESDVKGRAIVSSATMVLPDGDDVPVRPATSPLRPSTETIDIHFAADPPKVGGPARMAWIAGILTAAGLVGGLGWAVLHPTDGGEAASREAAVAATASEAVSPAPPAGTGGPVTPPPVATVAPEAPVAPAADPAAAATPAPPAPAGSGAPKPTAAPRQPDPAVAVPVEPAPAAAELLRSAKFVLAGSAERIDVQCGGVSAGGSGNALLQNFPIGTCLVQAGGASTTVSVQEPRKVECALEGSSLSCR